MATSSSDSSRAGAGVFVGVAALCVAIAGGALLAFRLSNGGTAAAWAIFAFVAVAMFAVLAFMLLPRQRALQRSTRAAEALAAGDFTVRTPVSDNEYGALESALNAAAENIERLVAELAEGRAQLEALLNASGDATVAVDAGGAVEYMNDAARAMFFLPANTPAGRQFIETVRDHDLNELVMAAAQRGERSVLVVPYGRDQRWLQATAVPIDGARSWAALAVFHDLTEVRRLDSVRRDFISNVSHELRTPLAGIRAAAETLQEGAIDDRPAAIEFLGHIQRETDRITQLVEELLELSRIESGAAPMSFDQLDASELVAATVKRFAGQADRAGIKLRARDGAAAAPVIGDADRIEHALGNLVANAIKFTPSGGEVTVSAEGCRDDVLISVSDTGIGIEQDQQARVFERFYRADRGRAGGGTGLGLAIVKHIVLAHGGSVSVESKPGRGSTFTMRFPRR